MQKAVHFDSEVCEYEKKNFRCPKCKSKKMTRKITGFQTITSKKS